MMVGALGTLYYLLGGKYVPVPLWSKCMHPIAKAFMSLCNLCPRNFTASLPSFANEGHTVHCSQTTLANGVRPDKKDHRSHNKSAGWPLDVLMCEIMLLPYNIHRVWLAIHMWPYLPNGSLIWADRSTTGSRTSTVMHLTRNKAEINFP